MTKSFYRQKSFWQIITCGFTENEQNCWWHPWTSEPCCKTCSVQFSSVSAGFCWKFLFCDTKGEKKKNKHYCRRASRKREREKAFSCWRLHALCVSATRVCCTIRGGGETVVNTSCWFLCVVQMQAMYRSIHLSCSPDSSLSAVYLDINRFAETVFPSASCTLGFCLSVRDQDLTGWMCLIAEPNVCL